MAGRDTGMIIKVAADLAAMQVAFADISRIAQGTADTIGGTMAGTADDQAEVTKAVKDTEGAFADVSTAAVAAGSAIGTFAANAATAVLDLAWDAVKELSKQIWQVIDDALALTEAWQAFKSELSDAVFQSGVLQAGIETLADALLKAFGATPEEAIRTIVRLIEDGAIKTLEFARDLITLGEYGVQGISALIVPIDAVMLGLSFLAEKYAGFIAYLLESAASIPIVGDKYKELAAIARDGEKTFAGWKDEANRLGQSHIDLATGQGTLFAKTAELKSGLDVTIAAMREQQAANDLAAASVDDLSEGWGTFVDGNAAVVLALHDTNTNLAEMDQWSRDITNTDPFGVLLDNMTRTLPPLQATATAMKEVGTEAVDMAEEVRFAAEVVQKASLSWSEAMDLVRQGQGTMTGTVGPATKPAGMSEVEWNLMQSRPREWEQRFGYAWDRPTGAGTFGLFEQAAAAGTTVNQSVTVNTVAGDKQAIANVVKDALASDWRSQGLKG